MHTHARTRADMPVSEWLLKQFRVQFQAQADKKALAAIKEVNIHIGKVPSPTQATIKPQARERKTLTNGDPNLQPP